MIYHLFSAIFGVGLDRHPDGCRNPRRARNAESCQGGTNAGSQTATGLFDYWYIWTGLHIGVQTAGRNRMHILKSSFHAHVQAPLHCLLCICVRVYVFTLGRKEWS